MIVSFFNDFPSVVTTEDLAAVRTNVTTLAIGTKTASRDRLPSFTRLTHLHYGCADPQLVAPAVQLQSLEYLILAGSLPSLPPKWVLPRLRKLGLRFVQRLTSLKPLDKLTQVKSLGILNAKLISDYSDLARLTRLEELALGSDRHYDQQAIDTIEWLPALENLKALYLGFSKVSDGSIQHVAQLPKLNTLWLQNRFPREQIAYLEARLPKVGGPWFGGFHDAGQCRKCDANELVMMTGKRGGMLCRICDRPRFEKKLAEYRLLLDAEKQSARA